LSQPPPDTPNFDSLGHERNRAFTVWIFLRSHHGDWYNSEEIATSTGLAESTVQSALSRIFGLPIVMRPRIHRRVVEDETGQRKEYKFQRIIRIIFDE